MNFSKRLQYFLNEKDMSINQLAKESGISQPMLSKYLNNGSEPSLSKLETLASVFNVSLEYFLYGDMLQDIIEKKLILNFRKLSQARKVEVVQFVVGQVAKEELERELQGEGEQSNDKYSKDSGDLHSST